MAAEGGGGPAVNDQWPLLKIKVVSRLPKYTNAIRTRPRTFYNKRVFMVPQWRKQGIYLILMNFRKSIVVKFEPFFICL